MIGPSGVPTPAPSSPAILRSDAALARAEPSVTSPSKLSGSLVPAIFAAASRPATPKSRAPSQGVVSILPARSNSVETALGRFDSAICPPSDASRLPRTATGPDDTEKLASRTAS